MREKINRVLRRWTLPGLIAEYALECGMALWSLAVGANMAAGNPPSRTLDEIPQTVGYAWGIGMVVAGATIVVGLFIRPDHLTISRGMYLAAATLIAYSAAIVGTATWSRGGAIAAFLLTIGLVCLLRGWWLKDREVVLEKEENRDSKGN